MKISMCCKNKIGIKIKDSSQMLRTGVVKYDTQGINLIYAQKGETASQNRMSTNWTREREKLKEQLLPFIRETVKKQLKEEQEYYRSRPSLALKRIENILGAGNMENVIVPMVTSRVYERMEERLRHEAVRKGR